jgi:hypothetical protein
MRENNADFFIFGATSEVIQRLFIEERPWLASQIRRLVLVQRTREVAPAYQGFDHVVVQAEAADAKAFREALSTIVAEHASSDRTLHVFPTYGVFNFQAKAKKPHFTFSDHGFQINLNSRLQIIDAFRPFHGNTRFHLFGSLLGSFPYTGDYATSMWYINQLPRHPEYAPLDLRVYNLGGMRTRFWDHAAGPAKNPFVHDTVPTGWLRERMADEKRGVFDNFPTPIARIACTLGRFGLRML